MIRRIRLSQRPYSRSRKACKKKRRGLKRTQITPIIIYNNSSRVVGPWDQTNVLRKTNRKSIPLFLSLSFSLSSLNPEFSSLHLYSTIISFLSQPQPPATSNRGTENSVQRQRKGKSKINWKKRRLSSVREVHEIYVEIGEAFSPFAKWGGHISRFFHPLRITERI